MQTDRLNALLARELMEIGAAAAASQDPALLILAAVKRLRDESRNWPGPGKAWADGTAEALTDLALDLDRRVQCERQRSSQSAAESTSQK